MIKRLKFIGKIKSFWEKESKFRKNRKLSEKRSFVCVES